MRGSTGCIADDHSPASVYKHFKTNMVKVEKKKMSVWKGSVGLILAKASAMRISIVPTARFGVHARRVDSSTLVFSLSSHRYPYIVFVFSARFNDS